MGQIFGEYYSKEKIYAFPDAKGVVRHYKPRWFANPFGMDIMQCKQKLEAGYDSGNSRMQRGILVLTQEKWDDISKSYSSWVGLAAIHCFDTSVAAGTCPAWASQFDSYGGFLLHEYKAGKVVFMREGKSDEQTQNDLYVFFEDSAPPANPPVTPPVEEPDDEAPPVVDPVVPGIVIPGRIDIHIWTHEGKPEE